MKKSIFLGALLLTGTVMTAADSAEIPDFNKAEVWNNSKMQPGAQGDGFVVSAPCMIKSGAMIPVEEKNSYLLSCEVAKLKDAPSALFLLGFWLYDKDRQEILPQHVNVLRGTLTELAEEAKAGTSSLKIKNGARWVASGNNLVAFNAGPLPNRDISSFIEKVEKEGDLWTVSLKTALTKTYPAGTKVQIQSTGGYFYCGNVQAPGEGWQTCGGRTEAAKFWTGTAYIQPMFLANWNWGPERMDLKTAIRNFKFEVIPGAK